MMVLIFFFFFLNYTRFAINRHCIICRVDLPHIHTKLLDDGLPCRACMTPAVIRSVEFCYQYYRDRVRIFNKYGSPRALAGSAGGLELRRPINPSYTRGVCHQVVLYIYIGH